MKMNMFFVVVLLAVLPLYAQEETLLGDGEIAHGGYGGPEVKFTNINNQLGILVGGRGGWIINHTIVLGGAGYGLANAVDAKVMGPLAEPYLAFGYGGFTLEWIIKSDKLVHFSVNALFGGGGAGFRQDLDNDNSEDRDDACLVIEPGATVELNVTNFMRASFGASYRYVNGIESRYVDGLKYDATSDESLSGPALSILLRFGKF
jgi:hypothetical protein